MAAQPDPMPTVAYVLAQFRRMSDCRKLQFLARVFLSPDGELLRGLLDLDGLHAVARVSRETAEALAREIRRTRRKPDPIVVEDTIEITRLRALGWTWRRIGREIGITPEAARRRYSRTKKKK